MILKFLFKSYNQLKIKVGKKVKESDLYNKYKVHAIAVKRDKKFIAINENYTILNDDELVISGKNDDIEQFNKHRE